MAERIWVVDNEPSRRYPLYTRGNVGEVFPDTVAPLSWTFFGIPGAEQGWRDAFERFGAFDRSEFYPDEIEILGVFGGYCYLNVSVSRIFAVRTPGLTPELMDYTLFGEMDVPPYTAREGDESPEHSTRIEQTLGWVLTATDLPELIEDQKKVAAFQASRPDLGTATDRQLYEFMLTSGPIFRELFAQHLYITYGSSVGLGLVSGICAEALGDPTIAMKLVAGLGGVDSAAPSFAMWDLGRTAAQSPALSNEFDRGVAGLLERLQSLPEAEGFLAGFSDFVRDFGSRGPNEWESRSPTWETHPEMALAAIDRMRLASPGESPATHQAARAAEREAVAADVLEKLSGAPEVQGQMGAAIGSARVFLAGRERTKTTIIKLVHEVRLAAMELGRRMVAKGIFDTPQNIGMLRQDEFEDFLADPTAWRDTVLEREALYAELQALVPPFVIDGEPPPISDWEKRSTELHLVAAGTTLSGIPGCPGEATGRARVVLDAADPKGLEPGDVLIAPITDPSWTPLFVPAAAVVVDVGAQLSHAIIVSRELGIPCVVSVTDGTRKIPDGAMVRVDGTNGTVTVL